ncbi:hypothetical protein [Paenibacillus donghaensis]|uniref:DUF4829 domain-containing protein n=1 Tax=Paenibacillus donghaensis TaxID=414771 RepID=A0A2Z2K4V9_9BACL|nr:hypothetical protein [Paenibacillus donghaensis]ASA19444.1 hypothetical protein B9T62_00385 [Paenibacillus donghaensis]
MNVQLGKKLMAVTCISMLLSSCAGSTEAGPQATPVVTHSPAPTAMQSVAPSEPVAAEPSPSPEQTGTVEEADYKQYEQYVQDDSGDPLVFSQKEDLDLDGNMEIVLAYGNDDPDPKMAFISRVYVLREVDGEITRLDDETIATGGYGVRDIKLIHLEDMPQTYIYCGLSNGGGLVGFAVYGISGDSIQTQAYSASASGAGEDVLQDSDGNGSFDSYVQNRFSYEVLYYDVSRMYVLDDGEFIFSRTSVDIPEYPQEIKEVVLQFMSLGALRDGTSSEVDQRLEELYGPEATAFLESLPAEWSEPVHYTIMELEEGGLDFAVDQQGNKANVTVTYPLQEELQGDGEDETEVLSYQLVLTFTLQKENNHWRITSGSYTYN